MYEGDQPYPVGITKDEQASSPPKTLESIMVARDILTNQKARAMESGEGYEGINKKLEEIRQAHEKALLSQADRFGAVFRTERGSTYFVLSTGESYRIKRPLGMTDIPVVCQRIIYVPKEEDNRLIDALRQGTDLLDALYDHPIRTVPVSVGAVPIEIGRVDLGAPLNYEITADTFTLRHCGLLMGAHIGHPITEIIKPPQSPSPEKI
jgi:hypothetical protein